MELTAADRGKGSRAGREGRELRAVPEPLRSGSPMRRPGTGPRGQPGATFLETFERDTDGCAVVKW